MPTDIEIELSKAQGRRLAEYRIQAGFGSAASAAKHFRWGESGYRHHENGIRTIGLDDAERYAAGFRKRGVRVTAQDILFGPAEDPPETLQDPSTVSIMGMIGAGAVIEPDFDQTELHQVQLPIAVPDGIIGFEVIGDSFWPHLKPGDVVLVYRDQIRSLESFYGEEAAVRTRDGKRYFKTIRPGKSKNTVNLESSNAAPIENVLLDWIGEYFGTIKGRQIRRLEKARPARRPAAPPTKRQDLRK